MQLPHRILVTFTLALLFLATLSAVQVRMEPLTDGLESIGKFISKAASPADSEKVVSKSNQPPNFSDESKELRRLRPPASPPTPATKGATQPIRKSMELDDEVVLTGDFSKKLKSDLQIIVPTPPQEHSEAMVKLDELGQHILAAIRNRNRAALSELLTVELREFWNEKGVELLLHPKLPAMPKVARQIIESPKHFQGFDKMVQDGFTKKGVLENSEHMGRLSEELKDLRALREQIKKDAEDLVFIRLDKDLSEALKYLRSNKVESVEQLGRSIEELERANRAVTARADKAANILKQPNQVIATAEIREAKRA